MNIWRTDKEICQAIWILFGPHFGKPARFLGTLTPASLKSVYRRRVFKNHPDRATILNRPAEELNRHFQEITSAYEVLSRAVATPSPFKKTLPNVFYDAPASRRGAHEGMRFGKNRYFVGPIPRRSLLIGQFLYYSGAISWSDLIDAIVWQRRQRPRIGQIASDWKILSCEDIARIQRSRRPGERFGECGRRLNVISEFQLMALIGRQRMLQKPFGFRFTGKGELSHRDLKEMERRKRIHNYKFRS